MEKIPLEIIIPIYNEGDKVIKLLNLFQIHIKTKFKVLLCYDLNDDNIFNYEMIGFLYTLIIVLFLYAFLGRKNIH